MNPESSPKGMSASVPVTETTIIGERTQEWRALVSECPALGVHGIAHVGVCHAAPPYEVVRLELKGAYMLSCFAGSGSVLRDGRWQRVEAGTAFLAPPRVLLAFKAQPGVKWGFSWVRYQLEGLAKPVVSHSSPSLARFSGEAMRNAVLGVYHEVKGGRSPVLTAAWVRLVHEYVLQFAQPEPRDPRLERLWEEVASDLKSLWTLERMARICNLSEEHLRRLCRRELGRSPVHHLMHLRMLRAAELLARTDDKIEVIANEVGYANAFVFSNTFKRSVGWRPSEYRSKRAL
jgi:AraC-like DNA-binding protein